MFKTHYLRMVGLLAVCFLSAPATGVAGEVWLQLKYDGRHSGNVPERSAVAPLGLSGAVPLTGKHCAVALADGHVVCLGEGP